MGLDSSNRDIPNASISQHGSVSPSTVSLNYLSEETQIRRGNNSCRLRQDFPVSKKGSILKESMEEGGKPLFRSVEEGAQGEFVGLEESEDDPSKPNAKPTMGVMVGKYAAERLLTQDSSGEDSSSADESETSSTLERRAPDGGWGWVVVAAAFFINLVADGVTFSFGSFFVEFHNRFEKSKSATAWIGSLLAAMPLLSGPIASSLADRYGCRKVTVAGGFLASLGFILSSFATSIFQLYITFGMITGFGLSLCYVAAIVSVAYYFEQRRSLATGISVCGGGIGTFIFAPLTQFLIDKYEWQNATRILSIPFLYLCCCGLVMRDLEWTKKSRPSRKLNTSPSIDFSTNRDTTASYPKRLCSSAICIPTFVQDQERSARIASRTRHQTVTSIEAQRRPLSQSHAVAFQQSSNNSPNTPSRLRSDSIRKSPRQKSQISYSVNPDLSNVPVSTGNFSKNLGSINGTPPNRHQSSATQGIQSNGLSSTNFHPVQNSSEMGLHRHSLTYRGAVVSLKRYRLRPASSCPDIISVATTEQISHEWKAVVSDVCKWARALFEWRSLSCSRRFILFVLSNFLLYMWYDVVYIYLQDSAKESVDSESKTRYSETEASYLISILGLFNMVGNLSLGYMGDKEGVDATLVYGICMILCGFSVIMLPTLLSLNYVSLALDCGLYGVAIAANYSLTSVILVKVVSLERFSTAYGLLLLVQGIGNLVGPPLAGLISDWTDSSSWSFWVAGIGILLSSLFVLIPKIFSKCSKSIENGIEDEEEA